ncbi:MAG: hypothetical protein LBQ28_10630 [Prevotellaceae bacterium]|nr:hypothetical protein [Prevotellaceae bacterium]
MTNLNKKTKLILLVLASICFINCENNLFENDNAKFLNSGISPMSIIVPTFDWENIDWMPTPPGQPQIPPPWIGQGCLAANYGIDVLNDIKAADGWVLLYNTFDANAPGQLVNPYFILYNKYRGLMRIYLYVTTQFVATSTYLQDGIFINSNAATSMLNFLGTDFVDATANTKMYSQMQPAPVNGSLPLAANKWYMLQYEMAYDPNISQIPYNNIQLGWYLNYYNVDSIKLGGEFEGKLNGTIGSASSSSSNFFSDLGISGQKIGTGALALIGQSFITNNTTTGDRNNQLGLPNNVFSLLSSSVNNLMSSTSGGLTNVATNLLSAIVGGSSGSGPTPISLNLNAKMELRGTQTSAGSFPSMPTSFWMPGTNISSSAAGYIPAYNEPLGVINFNGKPTITINVEYQYHEMPDEPFDPWYICKWTDYSAIFPSNIDYSNYLIINPEVLQIADVTIEKQDLVYKGYGSYGPTPYDMQHSVDFVVVSPERSFWRDGTTPYERSPYNESISMPQNIKIGVRFTIKIVPKNGSPSSVIIKTFQLSHQWNYIQTYYWI